MTSAGRGVLALAAAAFAGTVAGCLTAPPAGSPDGDAARGDGATSGDGGGDGDGDERVVAIGGGGDTFCAVTSAGRVHCWGDTLGVDPDVDPATPSPIVDADGAGLTDVVEIAVGTQVACARLASGDVSCWGDNSAGQLGDAASAGRAHAALVPGLTGATALAVGSRHACVLRPGDVACWGDDGRGQLGDGCALFSDVPCPSQPECDSTTASAEPVAVATTAGLLLEATAISASGRQTCAIGEDAVAYCFGENGAGQSGRTAELTCPNWYAASPVGTSADGELTGQGIVAAATQHACAATGTSILCWGEGGEGQLGWRSSADSAYPVAVDFRGTYTADADDDVAPCEVTTLVGTGSHSCAGCGDGRVVCWGNNDYGQLGDGTSSTYEWFAIEAGVVDSIVDLAVGVATTCALRIDGAVLCWGRNDRGQLGDGLPIDASSYSVLARRVVGLPGR